MASLATSSYGASTAGRYCRPVFLAGQSLLTLSDTRCLNRPSCHNNKALAQRPCNGTRRPSTPAWPTTSVCLPIGTASLRQGALFFFFIYYRCSYEKELTLVSLLAGDWRSTTAGIANTQRSSPTPRQRAGLGSTWRTVFFPSTFFFFFFCSNSCLFGTVLPPHGRNRSCSNMTIRNLSASLFKFAFLTTLRLNNNQVCFFSLSSALVSSSLLLFTFLLAFLPPLM